MSTAADAEVAIHLGDVREVGPQLPVGLAQTIVTSPPYYRQRRYDPAEPRELGHEPTVSDHVAAVVASLAAVRHVLREDGTLWLNLGDKYLDGALQGIPWRVAHALVDDGWVLRADIIWHKPNAMPTPVTSRPTVDHEYLFLLAKRPRGYYYDADAIREPHVTFSEHSRMRGGRRHLGVRGGTPEAGKNTGQRNLHDARWDQAFHPAGRNRRTVWSVPLGKNRDAHFAVFPPALITPCILAGSPPGGVVLDPFLGAGTTAVVARELGRRAVGIELVARYAALARRRLERVAPPAGEPDPHAPANLPRAHREDRDAPRA